MQTLTEQLVEAVDMFLKAFPKCAVDEARDIWGVTNTELIRVYRNDLIAALDRARADPEALLRENGEVARRLGNELMEGKGR